jgi:hypothetical protein
VAVVVLEHPDEQRREDALAFSGPSTMKSGKVDHLRGYGQALS